MAKPLKLTNYFDQCDAHLVSAARAGKLDDARLWAARGATKVGRVNALNVAAAAGHVDVVNYLLGVTGANAQTKAMVVAAANDQLTIVRLIADHGAVVDFSGAAKAAIRAGHIRTIEYLLARLAAVNWNVCLEHAVECNQLAAASLLIRMADEAGAPLTPDQLTKRLRMAAANDNEEMARLLIFNGAIDIFEVLDAQPLARPDRQEPLKVRATIWVLDCLTHLPWGRICSIFTTIAAIIIWFICTTIAMLLMIGIMYWMNAVLHYGTLSPPQPWRTNQTLARLLGSASSGGLSEL